MTYKVKRYSEAFKRQVVSEYEAGASLPDLGKKYGITGSHTIQHWVSQYGQEGLRHRLVRIQTTEEANQVRELEQQVQRLERALGQMTLEKLKLESILAVLHPDADEQVKKNGPSSSNASGTKLTKTDSG